MSACVCLMCLSISGSLSVCLFCHCLCGCLNVCLAVCLYACVSNVCLYVCVCFGLSKTACTSLYVCQYLSVCMSLLVCMSVCISVCVFLSVCRSVSLSVCQPICLLCTQWQGNSERERQCISYAESVCTCVGECRGWDSQRIWSVQLYSSPRSWLSAKWGLWPSLRKGALQRRHPKRRRTRIPSPQGHSRW